MTALLQTSSAFASATAQGADWRDVGRQILEALESIRTPDDGMNIGFLYVTSQLAADLQNLLTPVQKRLADGCHLNRNIEQALLDAHFSFTEKHCLDAAGIPKIAQRMLFARAQKQ